MDDGHSLAVHKNNRSSFIGRMVNLARYSPGRAGSLPRANAAEASMTQNDLEHWICAENIDRYQKMLSEPPNKSLRKQVEGLLTRELAKKRAMFPG